MYHRTRNTHGRNGRVARSTNLPAAYTVGTPQPQPVCVAKWSAAAQDMRIAD